MGEHSPRNDYGQGGSRHTHRERSYERSRSRYSEERDERRYSGESRRREEDFERREERRDEGRWRNESSGSSRRDFDDERSGKEGGRSYKREHEDEYEERRRDVKRERDRSSGNEDRRQEGSKRRREEDVDIEEISREGNFSNWSTATVKVDPRTDDGPSTSTAKTVNPATVDRSVEEEVQRVHKRVADSVMQVLNMYYPESKTFMGEAKIVDPSVYSQMAKKYSHKLRNEIKESYEDFNHGSLEGITFTPDNKDYIKNFMEAELDKMPVLRRSRK